MIWMEPIHSCVTESLAFRRRHHNDANGMTGTSGVWIRHGMSTDARTSGRSSFSLSMYHPSIRSSTGQSTKLDITSIIDFPDVRTVKEPADGCIARTATHAHYTNMAVVQRPGREFGWSQRPFDIPLRQDVNLPVRIETDPCLNLIDILDQLFCDDLLRVSYRHQLSALHYHADVAVSGHQ